MPAGEFWGGVPVEKPDNPMGDPKGALPCLLQVAHFKCPDCSAEVILLTLLSRKQLDVYTMSNEILNVELPMSSGPNFLAVTDHCPHCREYRLKRVDLDAAGVGICLHCGTKIPSDDSDIDETPCRWCGKMMKVETAEYFAGYSFGHFDWKALADYVGYPVDIPQFLLVEPTPAELAALKKKAELLQLGLDMLTGDRDG